MKTITKKLNEIQQNLVAPKNQRNNFGNYNYRSCEDILEAVKPLLGDCTLVINDEIINIGDRYYIKATATVSNGEESVSNSALARESEAKKGMDDSQITGSTSSYARKYALNGLFAIDDTKDADTRDNSKQEAKKTERKFVKDDLKARCTVHDTEMTQAVSKKTGNPYWYHRSESNDLCFGKGYQTKTH